MVKIAIPSATMAHFRGGRAGIDIQAYPNLDDFFSDIGRSAYKVQGFRLMIFYKPLATARRLLLWLRLAANLFSLMTPTLPTFAI